MATAAAANLPAREQEERKSRSLWSGNLTPWWAIASAYSIFFVCYLGLTWLAAGAPVSIAVHIVFSLAFVVCCSWNLFHTPSHGPAYRRAHLVAGWCAMVSGTVVVVTGYIIILREESRISEAAQYAFMATGALQIALQVLGVLALRRWSSVRMHIVMMSLVFYNSVLLPAVNRLPQICGFSGMPGFNGFAWTGAVGVIGIFFSFLSIWWHGRVMRADGEHQSPGP